MKPKYLIVIFILLIIFSGGFYYENSKEKREEYVIDYEDSKNGENNLESSESVPEVGEITSESLISAYICGEVKEPGVYEVTDGSRIIDLLDLAGGFTEEAAVNYINLAEKISDGERIYVPKEEEISAEEYLSGTTSSEEISLIDINKANLETLKKLPGIGDAKASNIIRYREENGNFKSIDEIVNVSGIGDALFNSIKDYIKV